MTPSSDKDETMSSQDVEPKKPRRRRGKARSFDFGAIEHVGNDATEGGFLGDDSAETERRATSTATISPMLGGPSVSASHTEPTAPEMDDTHAPEGEEEPTEAAGPLSLPAQTSAAEAA
ncbi:hypothetical protein ACIG3E_32775, partial [Streptomyces sp. NPDC053474]|uniref:hypothetical protein n=1 Tax=Streptomyces sp. NPDC053474 TaxID=3365704 RepID=UPI0037D56F37